MWVLSSAFGLQLAGSLQMYWYGRTGHPVSRFAKCLRSFADLTKLGRTFKHANQIDFPNIISSKFRPPSCSHTYLLLFSYGGT